jgi:hypothetical protein
VVRVPSVEEEDARHLHRELGRLKRERLQNPRSEAERRVVHLMRLGAIGPTSAWLLVKEFFGWRAFRNRREVAALAGLVGTPYVGVLPHGGRAGGRYRSSCRPPRLARRASRGHLRRQPADGLREVPEQEHRHINGDTRRTVKPETSATAARSTARAASSHRPKPRKCWTGRRRILPGTRARLSRARWSCDNIIEKNVIMLRTQISLSREEYAAAKREAKRLGISLAELLRRSLRSVLPAEDGPAWMRYAGMVESGDPRSSVRIDEIVYGGKN